MCVKCGKDVGYIKIYDAYVGEKHPTARYECASCGLPVLDAFEDKLALTSQATHERACKDCGEFVGPCCPKCLGYVEKE